VVPRVPWPCNRHTCRPPRRCAPRTRIAMRMACRKYCTGWTWRAKRTSDARRRASNRGISVSRAATAAPASPSPRWASTTAPGWATAAWCSPRWAGSRCAGRARWRDPYDHHRCACGGWLVRRLLLWRRVHASGPCDGAGDGHQCGAAVFPVTAAGEVVATPRHSRRAERWLARAQRGSRGASRGAATAGRRRCCWPKLISTSAPKG
jgi:hypothetical protein